MNPNGTILITGANRGIGLGLARQFLARGWQVTATCRQPEATGDLADLARAHPDRCVVTALEVRDTVSVAALAAALATQSLDVLVNNAGINPAPRDLGVDRVAPETVADALDTNVLGALRVLQAAVPALRRSACPRIVNISSGAGSLAHNSAKQPLPAYCISKAALNMLTRCAARDLPGFVTVSISPGWIKTDMGGTDAEVEVDDAASALVATITGLQPSDTGRWLDRFGRPSAYAW